MATVYKNCCICISLKTGSLILGYLNLIVLICSIIIFIYNITVEYGSNERHSVMKPYIATWTSVLSIYILLAVFIIALIFSILLLVGVHGNKHSLVKAYLIFTSTFIILYLIGLFTQLGSGGLNMAVNDLGVVCVALYYYLIIRSYYIVTWEEVKPNIESELPGSVKVV